MQEAYRFIIGEIISGRVKNSKDLEKVKHRACREYNFPQFISNSEILQNATPQERIKIAPIIKKKPTRTLSGVAIVAVMCKPHQCPHGRCLYCPESEKAPPSYTGEEPAALRARRYNFHPYLQVYNRLEQLQSIGHPVDKVELIIMGGTFPSSYLCYQEWFVSKCIQAMNDFRIKNTDHKRNNDKTVPGSTEKFVEPIDYREIPHEFAYLEDIQRINEKSQVRCVGMTFETRPDYCKGEDVDRMLQMGVTRVELGVQTIYNFIYHRISRGHRVEDVVQSAQILRDSGIKIAMHLMPGLFADQKRDLRIFRRIFTDERFKPDMLKIYPCLVTKGSKLHQLWKKGEYLPYTTEEAVNLIVEIKKFLPKWVRTMRIQRDIPSPLIEAGVKKSNLGELVYQTLENQGVNCKCIRCREVGHRASLGYKPDIYKIKLLKEEYQAAEGREIFISYEDVASNILIGFCRLRIPSDKAHRREIDNKTALIRELHVYGSMVQLGDRKDDLWQHQGYGEGLLGEAEKIASEYYDKNKLLVNSGIGARSYYSKFGYRKEGPYMAKLLRN
ncbi:MAG: tRNA uridine(34) 5-carboxymethylaminomethyl modification radical SAM/GNAT enzyme Elp3 [Methanobacterium sp.]|nr:tRNA uridine(34) 5-carboxymethylaminomethyl modification radical SAM/GNAT enzyme Elp3 [Methanobacterium sp.]